MIKCKVCGAANSLDSSVCVECGAALRASRKNTSTDSEKEIFSNTKTEKLTKSGEQRIDLFSSGEKYEKMRKGAVLEKIYKQEQAMGEITELEEPPEPEEVKPIVINRQSSSDIVGKKKKTYKKGNSRNKTAYKDYKIPQRVIEPVNPGNKNNSQTNADSKNNSGEKKQNSQNSGNPEQKKKNYNSENSGEKNKSKKNTVRSENYRSKKTSEITSELPAEKKPKNKTSVKKESLVKDTGNTSEKDKSVKSNTESVKASSKSEQTVKEQNKVKKTSFSSAAETTEKAAASEIKTKKPQSKSTAKSSVNAAASGEITKKEKPKPKSNPEKSDKSVKTKKNEQNTKSYKVNSEIHKPKKAKTSVAAVKDEKPKNKPQTTMKTENTSSQKSRKFVYCEFTESDINSNKNFAALAYIGILFLIPLLKSKNSDFCRVHTKQGIAVFIYSLIIILLTLTAVIGLRILLLWKLELSYTIYNIFVAAIGICMLIFLLIPVFSGAVSAFSGIYKSVPIVGKFVSKKRKR